MSSTISSSKRRGMDVMKLMMTDYEVRMARSGRIDDFYVKFEGPKGSPYEDGHWNVHVILPEEYPYKSPSIGFCNKLYHPNVDEGSGSVCLDVINQTWSPMFDLVNIFEVFLPQLLLYPNPTDPLNSEAAALHLKDMESYKKKVRDLVTKHARLDQLEDLGVSDDESDIEDSDGEELSDLEDDDLDDPIAAMEL